jgi:formylglycine-generating enzyme required for sulfatase activity
MGTRNFSSLVVAFIVCIIALITNLSSANNIRGINIDFVNIGHAGNAADTQVMSDGTSGYGSVSYNYQMGKYEITNSQWNTFTTSAGAPIGNPSSAYNSSTYWTGNQKPTTGVSWYEAAQFCNWLTSGNKSLGAYQFGVDGSITVNRSAAISAYGTVYVLPTENEWYKAAYYKPDGSGYTLYANGKNTYPSMSEACYGQHFYNVTGPWNVGSGAIEQNGTFDMMGNVWEWNETAIDLSSRGFRGGAFYYSEFGEDMISTLRYNIYTPDTEYDHLGFRIASIPEPMTLMLLAGGIVWLRKKCA